MSGSQRHGGREFWLRLLIPATLLVLLLIWLFASATSEVIAPAIVVLAAAVLAGSVVGALTGARGPDWIIYALILGELAVLLVSPPPWQGLALICVPASAIGFAMGKEVAFLRLSRQAEAKGSHS